MPMRLVRTTPRKNRSVQLISCIILVSVLLSACSQPAPQPKTVTVLDPVEITHLTLGGRVVTSDEGQVISPDGKYLLMGLLGDARDSMVAVPIGQAGGFEDEAVRLYSADTTWTHNNLLQLIPVGWLSDTECIFVVHGWQDQGPHKGDRGMSIYHGDIETGTATFLEYAETPTQGQMVEHAVLTSTGKVYLRVAERFWEYDVASEDLRLVTDGFPVHPAMGLVFVAVSPTGEHVVYSLNEEGRRGVFIMDVASGKERELLPTGDSMSFYPIWSPDGRYIAAYTAEQMTNPSLEGTILYNFIPGEDGPMPAAKTITVLDVEGNVVKTIRAEGQFLSQMAWLADGKSLVYLAGPVTFGKWGEVQSAEYKSAWIEDVSAGVAPVQVVDIAEIEKVTQQHTSYIFPGASLPPGDGALLNIGGAKGSSVWRVSTTAGPERVADGWWQTPRITAHFKDSVAGIIGDGEDDGVWLVSKNKITQLGVYPVGTAIAAHNRDLLILESHSFPENQTQVWVYRMLTERLEQ